MTTHSDDRGVPRQDHYGEGRQPFDDILEVGWAPEFAAGNVLKYLRRTKAPEHSLESARWYWARLDELARGELVPAGSESFYARDIHVYGARSVKRDLEELLTKEELNRLTEG